MYSDGNRDSRCPESESVNVPLGRGHRLSLLMGGALLYYACAAFCIVFNDPNVYFCHLP